MPDRVQVVRGEERIMGRAAQIAHNRIVGVGTGSSYSSVPSRNVTQEGTDGDGNIITVHDFMLGVDALGDPAAELRVKGTVTIYGS